MTKAFLLFIIAFLCKSLAAQTCNLLITVPNIKNIKGHLQVKIYNNENSFPKPEEQYREAVFKIDTIPGLYYIKDLPTGTYAVAILHDENSDKNATPIYWVSRKRDMDFQKISGLSCLPLYLKIAGSY